MFKFPGEFAFGNHSCPIIQPNIRTGDAGVSPSLGVVTTPTTQPMTRRLQRLQVAAPAPSEARQHSRQHMARDCASHGRLRRWRYDAAEFQGYIDTIL